jgi:hypothetical protein
VLLTLDIVDNPKGLSNNVFSDKFNRKPAEAMPLAWRRNQNPDNRFRPIAKWKDYKLRTKSQSTIQLKEGE